MYYRYEMIIDNKKYGIFVGLEKIGLDEDIRFEICDYFDKYLPIPGFYYIKGKNGKKDIFAYFTEEGNEKFKNHITNLIDFIEKMGYKTLITTQDKVGSRRLIYEDKYQALILKKG